MFEGLDGELVVGNPYDKNLMQQTMSGVMSQDGEPAVHWYIFDKWNSKGNYLLRAHEAKAQVQRAIDHGFQNVHWIPQIPLRSLDDLTRFEEESVALGYEGIMLRHPEGPYKQGRSTLKEGYLLKVKRFSDAEAIIIGVKEQMRNDNEAVIDAQGYTKRSTHADGKSAAGVLGALRVRDVQTQQEFDVGTGFSAEQRKNLWAGRKYLIGKQITYKHFPIGVKDLPRFPTFKAFRDRRD